MHFSNLSCNYLNSYHSSHLIPHAPTGCSRMWGGLSDEVTEDVWVDQFTEIAYNTVRNNFHEYAVH